MLSRKMVWIRLLLNPMYDSLCPAAAASVGLGNFFAFTVAQPLIVETEVVPSNQLIAN